MQVLIKHKVLKILVAQKICLNIRNFLRFHFKCTARTGKETVPTAIPAMARLIDKLYQHNKGKIRHLIEKKQ